MTILKFALSVALGLGGVVQAQENRLTNVARIVWTEPDPRFGGLSGIEVLEDGNSFLAISDRGAYVQARMIRDDGGNLTGVQASEIGSLHDQDGNPLSGWTADAEGLAITGAGDILVSFEGKHRISSYATIDGPAKPVELPRDMRKLQFNSALEALAVDDEGTIYTIPERSGKLTRPFPIYRKRANRWDAKLSVPRRGDFLIVGLDLGPDGRLYVLERAFYNLLGFATRIRSFEIGQTALSDEVTLLETPKGQIDNFEGISVWRDPEGQIRITLVADDNFFPIQSTSIAEYILRD